MAISNFYLPTGLTVSGSSSLTGSLYVTKDVNARSFTGSFSGSDANITNISASTISANNLLLPEDFVLIADTVLANSLQVYSASVLNTVLANEISASNLYLENPFLMIADTIQTTDLEVLGNSNFSGAINLHTTSSYNILTPAVSASLLDVGQSLKILDSNSTSAAALNTAYDALRVKTTGSLDSGGFRRINLTSLGAKFETGSLDYIALNTSIKDNDKWVYSGISVEMYNSASSVYVEISANPNAVYRLLAVNEKSNIFVA